MSDTGDPARVRVILCTAPPDRAEDLAARLVDERLAACVNLVPGLLSLYHWQGEVHRDPETLLVCKTDVATAPRLLERLADLHPYDVPEGLSLPVEGGLAPYAAWVAAQSAGTGSDGPDGG